jgi:hypothetical protein
MQKEGPQYYFKLVDRLILAEFLLVIRLKTRKFNRLRKPVNKFNRLISCLKSGFNRYEDFLLYIVFCFSFKFIYCI